MIRSNVISESATTTNEQTGIRPDDGALLAAALAATLVEYQSHVGRNREVDGSELAGTNWRIVGCMERLRGRA